MKQIITTLTLLGVLLTQTSCAVMFNGSKQDIIIRSMTPESQIYVDGQKVGEDAVNVKLARKSNHVVMVKKEGYETETVNLEKHLEWGWIVVDGLLNWFGFLTDAPTGAWNSFENDNVVVELEPTK